MVRLWCWSVLELQASGRLGLGLLLVAHDENPQARSPGAMADTGATWVWENRLASADASDQSYPKLRCTTVTCEKGAGRSRRPIRTVKSRLIGLRLLRCARVRCSIPHAASLRAIGFGLCGRRVSRPREGRAREGSAIARASIETRPFMAFSPLRWTKPRSIHALFETYVPGTPDPIAG